MEKTVLNAAQLLCVVAAAWSSSAALSEELKFEPQFTKPGVVSDGWLVRNWSDVSEPPRYPLTWEVDTAGILYGTGRYSSGDGKGTWVGTWLMSSKEYSDFVLELEFKFKNGGASGNGGVALRAPLNGDPAYEGMEAQITDERFERHYFPGATNAQFTGALYLLAPPKKLAYVPGEWNRYRIEARGPLIKIWLNGKPVQDVDLDKLTQPAKMHGKGQELLDSTPGAKRPRRGHIGFQDLSENYEEILLRNVQIAEIK